MTYSLNQFEKRQENDKKADKNLNLKNLTNLCSKLITRYLKNKRQVVENSCRHWFQPLLCLPLTKDYVNSKTENEKVELAGVEPASSQSFCKLSTCLSCIKLSAINQVTGNQVQSLASLSCRVSKAITQPAGFDDAPDLSYRLGQGEQVLISLGEIKRPWQMSCQLKFCIQRFSRFSILSSTCLHLQRTMLSIPVSPG